MYSVSADRPACLNDRTTPHLPYTKATTIWMSRPGEKPPNLGASIPPRRESPGIRKVSLRGRSRSEEGLAQRNSEKVPQSKAQKRPS